MPTNEELAARLDTLEVRVDELRHEQAVTRSLTAMQDRDLADVTAQVHAHTRVLNALRETQLEQGRKLDAHDLRFDKIDERLEAVDERFDQVDQRLDRMDTRFDQVDQRLESMGQQIDGTNDRFEGMAQRIDGMGQQVAGMNERLDDVDVRLDRLGGTIGGLVVGVHTIEGLLRQLTDDESGPASTA